MKAVTNPFQFLLLLHNKCKSVLQLLQFPSLLSYLALKRQKIRNQRGMKRDFLNLLTCAAD